MAYWLFQGKPKYYRILDALRDFDEMYWPVTLFSKEIVAGDGVLVWMSGKEAGIYAVAEVIEPAHISDQLLDLNYWIDASRAADKVHAKIRFTRKLIKNPLMRSDIKKDPPKLSPSYQTANTGQMPAALQGNSKPSYNLLTNF